MTRMQTKMPNSSGTTRRFWLPVFSLLLLISYPRASLAEAECQNGIADRYGVTVNIGYTYDPSDDIGFVMLTGFGLFDYDKIWPHAAPEALRFKVEISAGATLKNEEGAILSAGVFALYYLDGLARDDLRPYVEGGIGGIFTQWRVDGQGSKINFNPQLGIGTEFSLGSGPPFLAALRLHHISNAGLSDDNRGVNSIVLVLGCFF